MAQLGGGSFASGAASAGLTQLLMNELANIKDPALRQWASAVVGATAAKLVGGDANTGASVAASETKNNEEQHNYLVTIVATIMAKNLQAQKEITDLLSKYGLQYPYQIYSLGADKCARFIAEAQTVIERLTNLEPERKLAPNDEKHTREAKGDISADPFWNDLEKGQQSLSNAYSSDETKQLYNVSDGKLVKFQPDNVGGWHAYEVRNPVEEVPTDVLRQMKDDGLISNVQYNKWRKNK